MLNIKKISFTKILLITFFLTIGFINIINGQNSKWQLHVGYDQMYVSPSSTKNAAERHWIWKDPNRGDLFTMRTSLTHGAKAGISYDVLKWWSINLNYIRYFRRYYVWSGTYNDDLRIDPNSQRGLYEIQPYVGFLNIPSKFLGATLSSRTWQVGTNFNHKLTKNDKWHMHYYLGINIDLYNVNSNYLSTPIGYDVQSFYTNALTNEEVIVEINGRFNLSNNIGTPALASSISQSIALSRAFSNGKALKFELGFRNIRFYSKTLFPQNYWDIELTYYEYNRGRNEMRYASTTRHNFPLYIGGFYSNLTLTFKPFKSKRDNPDWKPWLKKWKEKRNNKR